MKNINIKIVLTLLLTIVSYVSSAQTLKSLYFVDGAAIRHQLNPAFAPQSGYVGVPMLGNLGLDVSSNLGLGTFLHPGKNNELNTFMHKDVDRAGFLGSLKPNNNLNIDLNINLLQLGLYAWDGFNTFDINLNSTTETSLPYEMFDFLKSGMSNEAGNTYDFSNVGINTQNFIDIAFGHSRQINDKIRVGAKAKLLLGVLSASTDIHDLTVQMTQDQWMISSQGSLVSSGLKFQTDDSGKVTGMKLGDIGLNGVGMAFDLGGTYDIMEDLQLSLAVLDLGFLTWNNNVKGGMNGDPIQFNGFNNINVGGSDNSSFDNEVDLLTKDLEALFTFYEMKGVSIKNKHITNTTLNIGADYSLFENKLGVGLLSSTLFRKKQVISDVMISANYKPIEWFTLTGHTSISNVGWTWGGLVNFSPRNLNFFLGATIVSSKFTAQYIPVDKTILNINFGMNFYIWKNTSKQ